MKKDWYKSKTVWTAIVGACLAIAQAVGLEVPSMVYGLLGAFGLYSLRDAVG